jgi:hypothetical protein
MMSLYLLARLLKWKDKMARRIDFSSGRLLPWSR